LSQHQVIKKLKLIVDQAIKNFYKEESNESYN